MLGVNSVSAGKIIHTSSKQLGFFFTHSYTDLNKINRRFILWQIVLE